jgi:long-chain acyl-CoA synthetase
MPFMLHVVRLVGVDSARVPGEACITETIAMQEPLLAGALRSACERHATRIALSWEGVALSYGALLDGAGALAKRLVAAGPVTHEPVLVRCSNHPTDFVAFLGVWMAGALAAPIHRSAPSEVVRAIQSKARCPIAVDLLAAPGQDIVPQAPAGDTDDGSCAARRRMLEGGALVIFTSGSTGMPKGAVLSHAAFHGKLMQNQRLLQPGADTCTLLVLNNTFSFGIWVALMTLMQGGRVETVGRFEPRQFLEVLHDRGITFMGVVPTMIRSLFGTLDRDALIEAKRRMSAGGRLGEVVIGGEPLGRQLSAELREFIAPAELFDIYGLTETSTCDFVLLPKDYPSHPGSIGKPFDGIRCRVVGADGETCAPGVTGELQLRTPYIMSGYLGDDDLTRAAFADGWFRTGDLAKSDAEGFVDIVGRLKELIFRGGNKITPLEVELALLRCDGVAGALVTGMPDPILGQRIHALLVPRPGVRLSAAALRRTLSGHLERFKTPDSFYVADALPTGRAGKIDRGQLQARLVDGVLHPLTD